jgi:hypothetical protein
MNIVINAAKDFLMAKSSLQNDRFVFDDPRAADTAAGGRDFDLIDFTGSCSIDRFHALELDDFAPFVKLAGNNLFVFRVDAFTANDGIASDPVSPPGAEELGGGGADTIPSSPTAEAAGDTDEFVGAAGNDHFVIFGTDFASIDGNGGIDDLTLGASFDLLTFDLGTVASRVHDVEVISLEQAEGVTLRLSDTNVPPAQ